MTATIIALIILIGLVLIFLEIFFIPGTTVFGIGGGVAVLAGVILVYVYYGTQWGNIIAAGSVVAVILSFIAGFKVIQSDKLSMHAEIKSKVNEHDFSAFKIGDIGKSITTLRPAGKANISGHRIEVYSADEYIAENTGIEIVKITADKIFVKPTKL